MTPQPGMASHLLEGSETGKLLYQRYKHELSSWPEHLHTSLGMIFNATLPLFLIWEHNGSRFFYNDAFSTIVKFQGKHPELLGQDIKIVSPFLWNKINEARHVKSDVLLPVTEHDTISDAYWNIHTSSVVGDELLLGILQPVHHTNVQTTLLKNAENKFNNIVNQSPIATSIFRGPEFIIEIANEQALALWGRDASVIGKKVADVFPELRNQPYMKLLEDVYQKGLNYEGKENLAYLNKNGNMEKVYVTFIYKPLHDADGSVSGILCMGYDVSDHVKSRDQILHTEERNRIALAAGNMGTFDYDLESNTVICSEQFYHIFGVHPDTRDHQVIINAIHPEDHIIRSRAHQQALLSGTLMYEARILRPNGSVGWMHAEGKYFFDEQHKPVRIVGIVQDITERKNTTEKIKEAEDKFRETVKHAPIGIAIFSGPQFTCEMANDTYLKLVDKAESEFLDKPLFESIPEVEPEVRPMFESIYATGKTIEATEFEVTLKRHNKYEQAFFNLVYQALYSESGAITGILVIASEVTHQVLTKHAILERERNFSHMIMQSPIAMTIFKGPDYVIEVANEELMNNIWRKKREDVMGRKALEVFPELNDQKFPELLNRVYSQGVVHREKEALAMVQGDDGLRRFYLDFEYSPLKDQEGSVEGVMITVNDVTDRVEARQKVIDAEARMRIAVEGTGTATWDLDLVTREIIYSKKLAGIFGHPEHVKLTHQEMRDQLLPDDRENIVDPAFAEAMTTGIYKYEARVVWPDQSIHWIRTQGKIIFDGQDKPVRMLGTMSDVSDRKEAEKASLLLASIVQSTDDAIISKTTDGIITSWNNAAERVFGYSAEEMIGKEISMLFPEGFEDEEPRILARLKQGQRVEHFETTRKHKSGRLIDVSLTISPIKDLSGNVIGASKIARDITDQKRIEKEIKDTQQQLEIVIEASDLGTWELNVLTSEMVLSDRYLEITGGNQLENPTHEELKKLIHPEDLPTRNRAFKKALETGTLSYETRLIWPDNTIHWIEARGKVFYDKDGKPLKLIGTIRDISEERTYQQTLSLSEQRFRNVANTVPAMIWMVDTNNKFIFLNKLWLDYTGLSIEEENDGDTFKGVHPEDYPSLVSAYLKAFENREPFYYEYRLKRSDGEYRWISDTGTPLFSVNGAFEGYIGACMDINDRILFEQKLKESESRLRIAALSSELGTWTYYPDTKVMMWDNSSRELFGVDPETPVTLDLFWSKMHPDDREQALEKMLRALDPAIADTYDTEYRIVDLPDQKIRWIHGKGKATFNEKNEPVIFAGTILDVTDKRLALEDLQESEQKFRLLADSMPQLIWTGDKEGNLVYFNQSVYDYSGKSQVQLMDGGLISIVHPDDREENIKQWMLAIREGKPFLFEHRFKRFDGEYRWQLSRAVPQRDAEGQIQQWVGTSTDIHDQKAFVEDLEHQVKLRTRELNLANEELIKSNAELAQFAYVASHDLQEPLRKIQTFSNRIVESESEKLSPRGADYFKRIQSASNRMQQLIIDLLSFSRANTSDKHFELTDLNVMLKSVQDLLRESITQKNARIVSDKLPVIEVIAYQFEQLLTNIISNAVKFTHTEQPLIQIRYEVVAGSTLNFYNTDPNQQYHHFSISDNGIGFNDEYRERIFQVFQRLHGRDKYEGTGIGLAIVKKIVENHNGYISAHGIENEGATFDIYFPVNRA